MPTWRLSSARVVAEVTLAQDPRLHVLARREPAPPETLGVAHQKLRARRFGGLHDFRRFHHARGQWFFHEYFVALLYRIPKRLRVPLLIRGDDDGVDLGPLDEFREIGREKIGPELLGHGSCPFSRRCRSSRATPFPDTLWRSARECGPPGRSRLWPNQSGFSRPQKPPSPSPVNLSRRIKNAPESNPTPFGFPFHTSFRGWAHLHSPTAFRIYKDQLRLKKGGIAPFTSDGTTRRRDRPLCLSYVW